MKYILVLVTLVLVSLAFYTYTKEDGNNGTKHTGTHKNIPTIKTIVPSKVVTPENIPTIQAIVPSKVVTPENTQKNKINKNLKYETFIDETGNTITIYNTPSNEELTIGKGLNLEDIQNSNLSEEKKELLIADMIYYKSMSTNDEVVQLSEEEALKLIENDVAENILE